MGRKRKAPEQRFEHQISIRFGLAEWVALERVAEQRQCTIGAVVRSAVKQAIVTPGEGDKWIGYSADADRQ